MKKAQVTALPISYIFIAVIAAIILIFGAKVIKDFYSLSEKAQTKKELQNLQNDIKRVYYLSKDSSQSITYQFSATISEICFAGNLEGGKNPNSKQEELIKGLKDSNIFLFQLSNLIGKENIDYLKDPEATSESIQCFSTQDGRLNIILTNNGNYVSLTRV